MIHYRTYNSNYGDEDSYLNEPIKKQWKNCSLTICQFVGDVLRGKIFTAGVATCTAAPMSSWRGGCRTTLLQWWQLSLSCKFWWPRLAIGWTFHWGQHLSFICTGGAHIGWIYFHGGWFTVFDFIGSSYSGGGAPNVFDFQFVHCWLSSGIMLMASISL